MLCFSQLSSEKESFDGIIAQSRTRKQDLQAQHAQSAANLQRLQIQFSVECTRLQWILGIRRVPSFWSLNGWNPNSRTIRVGMTTYSEYTSHTQYFPEGESWYYWVNICETLDTDGAFMASRSAVIAARQTVDRLSTELTCQTREIQQLCQDKEHNEAAIRSSYEGLLTAQGAASVEGPPPMLGCIHVADIGTVGVLSLLQEPEELAIFCPIDSQSDELSPGHDFAVFARDKLFDKQREDEMPVNSDGTRGAIRKLMSLLMADPR